MFERMTERVRRALVIAQEEARNLDHGYVGTEHLLLGIAQVDGVASQVLTSNGVEIEALRTLVKEENPTFTTVSSGPQTFTARTKKVLELGLREALSLGQNYVGTEHVLLGLIREGEGQGAKILAEMGMNLAKLRQEVVQIISGYGASARTKGETEHTEVVMSVERRLLLKLLGQLTSLPVTVMALLAPDERALLLEMLDDAPS